MEIIQSYLTQNPCYKQGKKLKLKGFMLHSIGVPQPNAKSLINSWNNPSQTRACVHGFIDANDGKIYQTLPWETRGWHAGPKANDNYIGIEMCEPDCIKYVGGATFTCSDKARAIKMAWTTYNSAVKLFAYLCEKYNLNPLDDGVILSHSEGYKRGIATNHGDPEHLWRQLGMGINMQIFRESVYKEMNQKEEGKNVTQADFNSMMDVYLAERAKLPAGWSQANMDLAVQKGIIQGDENGNIKAKSFCTRDEVVTMLLRALGY